MGNKKKINNLKDYAELAWAAYGYYDLMTNGDSRLFIEIQNKKNENSTKKEITLTDIMDNTFADYKVYKPQLSPNIKPNKVGTLNGDFSPLQSQNFFERYELLEHCPNTNSGFSATLFKDTKADSKDSEYILSIHGIDSKLNFKHKVA